MNLFLSILAKRFWFQCFSSGIFADLYARCERCDNSSNDNVLLTSQNSMDLDKSVTVIAIVYDFEGKHDKESQKCVMCLKF